MMHLKKQQLTVAAAVALSGCVGHHEKAVVAEPLKLSSVVVEQVVRV